jgi:nucleotidyltransferase/DNA polymerase involved in DNA repair
MLVCALLEPFILWNAAWQQSSLKDRALVALEKNKVIHASSLARRTGITKGLTLDGAKSRCSNLIVVETDGVTLQNDWQDVLSQLYAFTSFIESPSPGVVFLEVAEGDAKEIAAQFEARVAAGSSQEEARLQALAVKPGEANLYKRSLTKFPLNVLTALGVTAKTLERLRYVGVNSFADLLKWTRGQLLDYLGVEAAPIIKYLHGPFVKRVCRYTPPAALKAAHSFDEPVTEPFQLEPVVTLLAKRLEERLETNVASRFTLKATSQGLSSAVTKVSRNPLKQSWVIGLLARTALDETGLQSLGVDRLELSLSGLYKFSEQGRLWGKANIERAVEKVNERFPGALLRIEEVDTFIPDSDSRFRLVPIQGTLQTVQRGRKLQRGSRTSSKEQETAFAF